MQHDEESEKLIAEASRRLADLRTYRQMYRQAIDELNRTTDNDFAKTELERVRLISFSRHQR